MDDSLFAHTRPASAMRRNHSHTQYPERPASSMGDSRIYTPSLTSSTSAASSSQQSLSVLATPRQGSLLQERLRERKVESARAASIAGGEKTNERESVKSSPTKSTKDERRPGSGNAGKGMGVKQMEEQVSTLHKQNFDLKLELYHRRQRQEALEMQLEEKTKQLDEMEETRQLNDQLLTELERRDQALDEAVGVIVNLEEKIARLLKEREMVKSVDEHPYDLSTGFPGSSPDAPRIDEETPKRTVVRMPSFLSERSEHTEALRSLYLPHQHTFSETSLPNLAEEEVPDIMNSPRLSVLSESSFLSVYGDKLDLNAVIVAEKEQQRPRADSTVNKWVEEQPVVNTTRQSPDLMQTRQFLSINDVLESPLQRLEKLRATLERAALPVPERSSSVQPKNRRKDRAVKNLAVDKSFNRQQSLPPTPDTFSTNTLHRNQASNDTLAQRGTFLNTTSTFTPDLRRNAHESTLSVRPRSAGETVTSRREGHGWDTETQDDTADNESVVSASSTYAPSTSFQPLSPRVRRVRTPDLFNFSSTDMPNGSWGRDVMFNRQSQNDDLAPVNNKRILRARRSSMAEAEHPKSEDKVIEYNAKYLMDSPNHPHLPARRSSLVATTKIRKVAPSPISDNKESTTSAQTTPTTVSRTTRLASKLFGRHPSISSTTAPTSEATTPQRQRPVQHQRTPSSSYYPSVLDSLQSNLNHNVQDDFHSATPPPIRRAKTSAPQNNVQVMRNRPSSAGQGATVTSSGGRVKRMSGFHEEVRFEDGAGHPADNVKGSGKERKGSLSIEIGVARGLGALLGGHGNTSPEDDVAVTDGNGENRRKWLGLRRH